MAHSAGKDEPAPRRGRDPQHSGGRTLPAAMIVASLSISGAASAQEPVGPHAKTCTQAVWLKPGYNVVEDRDQAIRVARAYYRISDWYERALFYNVTARREGPMWRVAIGPKRLQPYFDGVAEMLICASNGYLVYLGPG